jgi:hypothetical protein
VSKKDFRAEQRAETKLRQAGFEKRVESLFVKASEQTATPDTKVTKLTGRVDAVTKLAEQVNTVAQDATKKGQEAIKKVEEAVTQGVKTKNSLGVLELKVSCVGLEQQARQLQHEQEKIRGNDYPDMLEEMVRYIGADIDSVEVKLENTLKDVTGLPGMQLLNAFQQGIMEHSTQIDTVFAQLDKRFEWCVTQQIQAQQQAVQLERQRQVQLERKKAEQAVEAEAKLRWTEVKLRWTEQRAETKLRQLKWTRYEAEKQVRHDEHSEDFEKQVEGDFGKVSGQTAALETKGTPTVISLALAEVMGRAGTAAKGVAPTAATRGTPARGVTLMAASVALTEAKSRAGQLERQQSERRAAQAEEEKCSTAEQKAGVAKLAVQLAVHAKAGQHTLAEQEVNEEPTEQAQEVIEQQQSVDMHFEIRKNALRGQLAKAFAKERSKRRANKQRLPFEEDKLRDNESSGILEAQQLRSDKQRLPFEEDKLLDNESSCILEAQEPRRGEQQLLTGAGSSHTRNKQQSSTAAGARYAYSVNHFENDSSSEDGEAALQTQGVARSGGHGCIKSIDICSQAPEAKTTSEQGPESPAKSAKSGSLTKSANNGCPAKLAGSRVSGSTGGRALSEPLGAKTDTVRGEGSQVNEQASDSEDEKDPYRRGFRGMRRGMRENVNISKSVWNETYLQGFNDRHINEIACNLQHLTLGPDAIYYGPGYSDDDVDATALCHRVEGWGSGDSNSSQQHSAYHSADEYSRREWGSGESTGSQQCGNYTSDDECGGSESDMESCSSNESTGSEQHIESCSSDDSMEW